MDLIMIAALQPHRCRISPVIALTGVLDISFASGHDALIDINLLTSLTKKGVMRV